MVYFYPGQSEDEMENIIGNNGGESYQPYYLPTFFSDSLVNYSELRVFLNLTFYPVSGQITGNEKSCSRTNRRRDGDNYYTSAQPEDKPTCQSHYGGGNCNDTPYQV